MSNEVSKRCERVLDCCLAAEPESSSLIPDPTAEPKFNFRPPAIPPPLPPPPGRKLVSSARPLLHLQTGRIPRGFLTEFCVCVCVCVCVYIYIYIYIYFLLPLL
jgi:hypothetical protein